MWIDVVIRYASVTDTSVEAHSGTSSPIRSSSREPIAGSPRKPRPSEVSVMPTCAADRYRDRLSIMFTAVAAPRLPRSASVCRCALRERTRANSAATKNALRRTRTTTASSSRAIIDGPRYFEGCRRRSSGRRAEDSVDPPGRRTVSRHTGAEPMRIVSLVPSATETLFALGVGEQVAAVTHECDFPADARNLPKVTRDVIGPGLGPDAIDRAVKELTEQGRSIYQLDGVGLRDLKPDLIVTQALCSVCAVSVDDVRAIAAGMDPVPEIVSLDPHTLGEVLGDVRTLAQASDTKDPGVALVQEAAARIDRVRLAVRGAPPVRVALLEWLDPVFVGGHWVPQLIEYAGGVDMLGMTGEPSEQRSWAAVAAARPQVVVVAPCGYDVERAYEEAGAYEDELTALSAERIVVADAAAWFSRPGPRLVDGLEWLAHALHPELIPSPPGGVREF